MSHEHCQLCGRQGPLTFHHFIPRTLHRNKWFKKRFTRDQMHEGIDVCRPCHDTIHQAADHKSLGREYRSRTALLAHPEIAKFVQWASRRV